MAKKNLRVYQLPDDQPDPQRFIDRAEEDLLCALSLYRHRNCGYIPFVNLCYLLQQAIEKWLKVLISMYSIPIPVKKFKSHKLKLFFEKITHEEQLVGIKEMIEEVRKIIEEVNEQILEHKYPENLRYDETPTDIESHTEVLLTAIFKLRRIIKNCLKRRFYNGM